MESQYICALITFSQIKWGVGIIVKNILKIFFSFVVQVSSLYKIMLGKTVGHFTITSTETSEQFSRIPAYLADNSWVSVYEGPYSW